MALGTSARMAGSARGRRPRHAGQIPRKPQAIRHSPRGFPHVLRPDTSADGFRFAHTSLQEFFLASHLARALREGRLEDWELPMPSLETLDFLGQLLATERRPERRQTACRTLARLLAEYRPRATEAAFRYRLLAIQNSLPEPDPGPVNLRGANLSGWTIAGRGPSMPINHQPPQGSVLGGHSHRDTLLRLLPADHFDPLPVQPSIPFQ